MSEEKQSPFVPVLTVLADYGESPFLWIADHPDVRGSGGNWCDGFGWQASYPMTESLWRQFVDWATPFTRTKFYNDCFHDLNWDWVAFNSRGLELAGMLKQQVGDAYRVIYVKPYEDPNFCENQETEVLIDGSFLDVTSDRWRTVPPSYFCEKILSGGQTGVDRAALDFAIINRFTHGGWAPAGRMAEDGVIPKIYQLTELPEGGYRQRTKRNVQESDGTLIVNSGPLEGGTLATKTFAQQHEKPWTVVQIDAANIQDAADSVLAWLRQHPIKVLNVAGPREGRRPGIYNGALALLTAMNEQHRKPYEE